MLEFEQPFHPMPTRAWELYASSRIARKHWESFAVGAAISGITLVVGENVCGIDPGLKVDDRGHVTHSP